MQHRHYFPTGKSIASDWQAGYSFQLTVFQKPRYCNMCENENSLIGGDGKKRRRLTLFVFGAVLSFGSSRAVAPLCCVVLLVVLPALCCCLLRGLFPPPFGWSLVLDDMLKEYDMKRDSVEINHNAPQWFFLWPAPLSFDWSPHLRLTCGPAGNRTTTGSLSTPQGRLFPHPSIGPW